MFSGITFVSRVFGYLRDATIMVVFGASGLTDAFLVAFRIPNFLRRLFAEGAFSQALVPVLAEFKEKHGLAAFRQLSDRTAGTLALVLAVVTLSGVLLAPVLVRIFAPGFATDATRLELAEQMLRIMFPYLMFISLTALCSSILNCFSRFALPAFTPVLLNLLLIASALWLAPLMEAPITALAWGVLIAGVAQLAIQLPALHRLGVLPRPKLGFRDEGVRRVMRLMSPALLGTSAIQINLLIDTIIASFLAAGSISWLYVADRFVGIPVGIFAVAIATILLPDLSRHFSCQATDRFNASLNWGVKSISIIALPCVGGLAVLAEPILISLIQYRAFVAEDTRMTYLALLAYTGGLPALMLIKVLNAAFFSRQNTRLPVRITVIAVLANIVLNIVFVLLWQRLAKDGAHAGLALATSVSAWLNCILLYRGLLKENITLAPDVAQMLVKATIAAAVMGAVLLTLSPEVPVWTSLAISLRLGLLIALVALGAGVYAATLWLLGVRPRQLATPQTAS